MRLPTAILCLLFMEFAAASDFVATVRFKCNLHIPFSGTIQLKELDTWWDDEITKPKVFDPTTAIAFNTHNVVMSGTEFEFWDQNPYIFFRHNCHPQGKVQDYKVHLRECAMTHKECRYEADVALGLQNTYKLGPMTAIVLRGPFVGGYETVTYPS